MGVDPLRTARGSLVALGRDSGLCPGVPDVLPEAMTGVAAIRDDPSRIARQLLKQGQRVRQFMGLPRCDPEGDRAACTVGDHAGFGPIPATRSAKSLTIISPGCRSALFAAPAAF
ncbi:hypothetical protein MRA01_37010 [Methylobacterium radiotolerans]|nr:hypothetical protein MRA01_37010 [Methylobacterium radiotolerans]